MNVFQYNIPQLSKLFESYSFHEHEHEEKSLILCDKLEGLNTKDESLRFCFFGEIKNLSDLEGYHFFLSSQWTEEKLLQEINSIQTEIDKKREHNVIQLKEQSEINSDLEDELPRLSDLEDEVSRLKEDSQELRSLKQYVLRLLQVKTLDELVSETENLRYLRKRGIRVSLIHSRGGTEYLYSRGRVQKLPEGSLSRIRSETKENLQFIMANLFSRPVLNNITIKEEFLNEGDFCGILESPGDIDLENYFLEMLTKILFKNFVRVIQSELYLRDTHLLTQAFRQIQLSSFLITRDFRIRFSNEMESVDQVCFKYIFNRNSPCPSCPLIEGKSGTIELDDLNTSVTSSFVQGGPQDFSFHIYETQEQSQRRRSIKVQRGKLRSLGIVTQALTHELNNPLMGIRDLAMDIAGLKTDQTKDDLVEISGAASRSIKIIENLKKFSSRRIEFQRIDLAETVTKALSFTKTLARSIDIHVEIENDLWIEGSDTLIQQIIFNLFKNSVEAMDGTGKIFISIHESDDDYCLEIRDSGPGFPDHMDAIKLFGTKGKQAGTGLGLFLVQEFIRLHRANFDFGNSPKGGAFFKIYFKRESRL